MERDIRRRSDGGIRAAHVSGEGRQPLVLLHGFPFDPTMWRPQLGALRRDARLLAPDLLGLGASRLPADAAPTIDDYAGDVLTWMDDAGISRAVVAGLSMGGYVALAMWKKARARIASLVLLDTKAEADGEEARRGREATREAIASGGMDAVCEGMLEKVLGETTRRARPDVVDHVRRMIRESDPSGAMAAVAALRDRPDRTELLATIDVPTLVVVGEEDALTPPSVARAMAERIRGARLVVIPEAGHVSSLEAPDKVTSVLREAVGLP